MQFGKTDPLSRVKRDSTDRAVSPVIGVILMVAITVILAAVIGVFVLGLADDLGDGPTQATLSFDVNDEDELEISHDGGDSMDLEEGSYSLIVDGESKDDDLGVLSDEDDLSSGETISIDDEEFDTSGEVDVSVRDDNADSIVDSGTVDLPDE